MNAGQFQGKILSDNGRVARLAASSESLEQIIDELYLATFSRHPSAEEVAILTSSVQQPNPARRQWIEDVLWSLMNSPEFFHVN